MFGEDLARIVHGGRAGGRAGRCFAFWRRVRRVTHCFARDTGAMQSLERYLAELPNVPPDQILGLVANVKNVVFHELAEEDFSLASHLLFSPNSKVSLLKYLNSLAVRHLEAPLAKAREAWFVFVAEYLQRQQLRLAVRDVRIGVDETCTDTGGRITRSRLSDAASTRSGAKTRAPR